MERVPLTIAALIVAACGGRAVIDESDASDQDATATATQTSSSAAGAGGLFGAGGQAGHGAAAGSGSGGGLAEGCPAVKPTGGTCAPEGLFCDYGGFCNSASCLGGVWSFPLC